MKLKYVTDLNFQDVVDQYNVRVEMSSRLISLLNRNREKEYIGLALGMDDIHGNYSARDHDLGPRILTARSSNTVFALAKQIQTVEDCLDLQHLIYEANIPYLKISVGTEIALMLQPSVHWVANSRSIWSHLLVKHRSIGKAKEELKLYRDGFDNSEMAYKLWCAIHTDMHANVCLLSELGTTTAIEQGVEPGEDDYLWADAVSNALYERHIGA